MAKRGNPYRDRKGRFTNKSGSKLKLRYGSTRSSILGNIGGPYDQRSMYNKVASRRGILRGGMVAKNSRGRTTARWALSSHIKRDRLSKVRRYVRR